jgi:hypothetical protein
MALVDQNHLVIVCAAHATDAHKAKKAAVRQIANFNLCSSRAAVFYFAHCFIPKR